MAPSTSLESLACVAQKEDEEEDRDEEREKDDKLTPEEQRELDEAAAKYHRAITGVSR